MNFSLNLDIWGLELVGAVGAQAHDVLNEYLVVGCVIARPVLCQLQADAAELAGAVVQHQAYPLRVVASGKQIGAVAGVIHAASIQSVVAQAGTPVRHELVNPLHIPARLVGAVTGGVVGCMNVVSQVAILAAIEIFALQLEVGVVEIAVRRPLPNEISNPQATGTVEAVGNKVASSIQIR